MNYKLLMEMLDALRDMTDMFTRRIYDRDGPDDTAARWDNARDVIAKAEGALR